jgi:3-oxoadipate enol-lactonase
LTDAQNIPLSSDARTIIGEHEADLLAGPRMLTSLDALAGLDPTLSRLLTRTGFGEVAAGATTGAREWALLTLAVLTAIGDASDQTEMYLQAAVLHGATDEEILDVINHASQYVGAPRAVNAARRMQAHLTAERDRRLPSVTEKFVSLGDHETLVWDNGGDGVPILLIHALVLDLRFWRDVYPILAKGGQRVVAYDIRGHGAARGAPLTLDLDHVAEDARMLLDRLDIEHADVYGASSGGAIAQHVVLNHPDRVRSLALIATGSRLPREILEDRAAKAARDGMQAQIAESLIRWFLPETIAQDTWMVRYARRCVERCRVSEWAANWRAMAGLDVIDRLRDVRVPALSLAGAQDVSATPDAMRLTAESIPGCKYVLLDPGTHMMPMEQAASVGHALLAFRRETDHALSSASAH